MNIFFVLSLLSLVATLGILFAGVFGMGKNDIDQSRKGNKLMRARIIAQACTLVFALLWVMSA